MPITKLTPELRKEIIESEETNIALARRLGLNKMTISKVRKDAGIEPKKRGRKSELSAEQIKEIEDSKLTYKEISIIYKIAASTVTNIKKAAGTNKGVSGRINKITPEQMSEVLNPNISVKELVKKYGFNERYLYKLRQRNNIEKVSFKREKRTVKPKNIMPKAKSKNKSTPMAVSKFEAEQKEREKSVKLAESYKMTEAEKLKNGYRWQTVVNEYGKKSNVLRKTN